MVRNIKPKSSSGNLLFNPSTNMNYISVVRTVPIETTITNTVTNNVQFDGNMNGGAITNVDSVSMSVFDMTVTDTANFSLQQHLEGTSVVQVSLFVSDVLQRRQSYICTSESETKKVFVLLADTDTNHNSQILAYESGIIGVSTFGQETVAKIARLSLV